MQPRNVSREDLIRLVGQAIRDGKIPPWVYHGTDSRAIPGIKQEGLTPRLPGAYEDAPGIWFSQKPSVATGYARSTARSPVVGPEEIRRSLPDSTFVAEPRVLRARLKPILPHLSDSSLETLAHQLENSETYRTAPHAEKYVHGDFFGREITARKPIPPSALKQATPSTTKGSARLGRFGKLAPMLLLAALLPHFLASTPPKGS